MLAHRVGHKAARPLIYIGSFDIDVDHAKKNVSTEPAVSLYEFIRPRSLTREVHVYQDPLIGQNERRDNQQLMLQNVGRSDSSVTTL